MNGQPQQQQSLQFDTQQIIDMVDAAAAQQHQDHHLHQLDAQQQQQQQQQQPVPIYLTPAGEAFHLPVVATEYHGPDQVLHQQQVVHQQLVGDPNQQIHIVESLPDGTLPPEVLQEIQYQQLQHPQQGLQQYQVITADGTATTTMVTAAPPPPQMVHDSEKVIVETVKSYPVVEIATTPGTEQPGGVIEMQQQQQHLVLQQSHDSSNIPVPAPVAATAMNGYAPAPAETVPQGTAVASEGAVQVVATSAPATSVPPTVLATTTTCNTISSQVNQVESKQGDISAVEDTASSSRASTSSSLVQETADGKSSGEVVTSEAPPILSASSTPSTAPSNNGNNNNIVKPGDSDPSKGKEVDFSMF